MQVYRGADVLTNKVTKEEMQGIPHHLLGFVDPTTAYNVSTFEKDAVDMVDKIHEQGDWPILVGGTHYYVQSILFKDSTVKTEEVPLDHEILSSSNTELFEFLKEVDPTQAAKLHPSDRRKVQSKVELYLRTGRPASELFQEQKQHGVESRWETLIFWVWSDRDALNERLETRVDKMIDQGLEKECKELYEIAQRRGASLTDGIFQAIGYREFVPVFANENRKIDELRTEAIELMKLHTKQYVKPQLNWINHKLLPQCRLLGSRTPIYVLDATDPTNWAENVQEPALAVARAFMAGQPLPSPSTIFFKADELLNPVRQTSLPDEWRHWTCDICKDKQTGEPFVIVGGEDEWTVHLRSRKHRSAQRGIKRKAEWEEWKAAKARLESDGDEIPE